ncbi:hypothetical protein FAGAP_6436 [Fusarium agapanthi]|uniref:Uncharacterized protein n=1 Tax=Fusarium agapanthi TaxID=1803897 RepID=A0A9P5B8J3_9HYPO|nr:hypothetical protein FAGAP_6436 [Fusarium agapanthi]
MASWDNRVVTNEHLLPYVDSNTAPPDIKAALQTLPFERNIFKATATLDAPYEWDVNEPVARVLGLTDEQIAALRNPKEPLPESLFTPRQRLIARIVEELSCQPRVSKDVMDEALKAFSHEEITEIFFLNGIYGFLARFMNSARIDFDEPIPGLLDILSKYNASAIEREKQAKK